MTELNTDQTSRGGGRRSGPAALAATALLAGVIGASVVGCDSNSAKDEAATTTTTSRAADASAPATTPTAPATDPAKVLEESSRTTQTLQSLHLDLTTTDLPEFPVASVNADVTNQPQGNGRSVGEAEFRPMKGADLEHKEFIVDNRTFYTKGEDGKYESLGPAEKIYDPGIILDRERGLSNVLLQIKDPVIGDPEVIDGIETVKVSGTIGAEVIDPVVPTLGQGGGTLPITVWIADVQPKEGEPTTTTRPSDQASPGTGPNLVRISLTKDNGSVQATLSKWGEPVEIPNPTG